MSVAERSQSAIPVIHGAVCVASEGDVGAVMFAMKDLSLISTVDGAAISAAVRARVVRSNIARCVAHAS